MALPAAEHVLPGPEEKHATILYFGDYTTHPGTLDKPLLANVCKIAAKEMQPFTAKVKGIKPLGKEGAHVWMLDSPELHRLFDDLQDIDTEVHSMYVDADITHYPTYRPHVTIGYRTDNAATTLATEDLEEAEAITEIRFDRIGLWWGKERYEWQLGLEEKVVRHVIDEAYWHQPKGTIIVGKNKTPLKELLRIDPEFNGAESVQGSDGQKYHIGQAEHGPDWLVIHDASHKVVLRATTEEQAYRELNAQIASKRVGSRAKKIAAGTTKTPSGPRKGRNRVLTGAQKEALLGVDPGGKIAANGPTLDALRHRGLIGRDNGLTDAGLQALLDLGGSVPPKEGPPKQLPTKPLSKTRTGAQIMQAGLEKAKDDPEAMWDNYFGTLSDADLKAAIDYMKKDRGEWAKSLPVAVRERDIRAGKVRRQKQAIRDSKYKKGDVVEYTDDHGQTTFGEVLRITEEGNVVVSHHASENGLIRHPDKVRAAPDREVHPRDASSPDMTNVFGGIRGKRPYTVVKKDREGKRAQIKDKHGDLYDVQWTTAEVTPMVRLRDKRGKVYEAQAGSITLRKRDRMIERERALRTLLREAQGARHEEAWPPRGPKTKPKGTDYSTWSTEDLKRALRNSKSHLIRTKIRAELASREK